MKIKSIHMAFAIILFIFGSIAATSALGLWQTTNDKTPAVFKEGDYKGEYNPADIRGSYTFQEISGTFNIPLDDLGKAFNLKDSSTYAGFKCKDLEALYGELSTEGKEIGTDSVRYFVSLYIGLPFTPGEDTCLPDTAIHILKSKASIPEEQWKDIEKHSVPLPE